MNNNLRLKKLSTVLTIVVSVLFTNTSRADQAYSDGFSAYLKNDFKAAQSFWLNSAQSGNARSMFNLGLLHEQAKIENAQKSKRNEWFRLAGNTGYVTADYHYALLILQEGGDKALANTLLNRAADNGFLLAQDRLNKPNRKINNIKAVTNVAVNKTVKSPSATTDVDGYLTETWINSKKPESWTIQLLAFKDENKVKRFIDDNDIKTKAAYFKETTKKDISYKLVYGVYKTKIQADFARQNLSTELNSQGPWLRSMDSVKKVIKAQ